MAHVKIAKQNYPEIGQSAHVNGNGVTAPVIDAAQEFGTLLKSWRQDTMFTSSLHQMTIHPAYQHIIALGQPAIPLILREFQENPMPWFTALKSITGEDPAENTSTLSDAANAWLLWGQNRGYIS